MVCQKCGAQLDDDCQFCPECGVWRGAKPPVAASPVQDVQIRPPVAPGQQSMPGPQPQNVAPSGGSSASRVVLIIAVVVLLIIIGVLLALLISKKGNSSDVENSYETSQRDYSDREQMMTAVFDDTEEEEEIVEIENPSAESQPTAEALSDLKILPDGFLDLFDERWLEPASRGAIDKVMRGLGSSGNVNLSGSVSGYPIVMELTVDPSGRVMGRYAYKLTLDKYGRGESSWFRIVGQLLSYGGESDIKIGLITRNPETGQTFEYMLLDVMASEPLVLSGRLCNVNYIYDPDGHWYYVDLA